MEDKCYCCRETLKKILYNSKFSEVTIYLKSRNKISFIIETKNTEKIVQSLIKSDSMKILDYDFVIFEGVKGNIVVNISQIDAFIIKEIEDKDE